MTSAKTKLLLIVISLLLWGSVWLLPSCASYDCHIAAHERMGRIEVAIPEAVPRLLHLEHAGISHVAVVYRADGRWWCDTLRGSVHVSGTDPETIRRDVNRMLGANYQRAQWL